MKYGLIAMAALTLGGVVYAASPSTQPTSGGSCCGMGVMNMKTDMHSGVGCTMGDMTPATQPAVSSDEHAMHH